MYKSIIEDSGKREWEDLLILIIILDNGDQNSPNLFLCHPYSPTPYSVLERADKGIQSLTPIPYPRLNYPVPQVRDLWEFNT
jgi:hypothetical protein